AHIPRCVIAPQEPACPGLRLSLLKRHVERGGRPRESWALLTDHPWELMAARRMQLRSVGIGYARLPLAVLRGLRPDAIAASPAGVPDCLPADEPDCQALCLLREPLPRVH